MTIFCSFVKRSRTILFLWINAAAIISYELKYFKVTKFSRHHRNQTVVAEKMETIIEVIIPMLVNNVAVIVNEVPEINGKLIEVK